MEEWSVCRLCLQSRDEPLKYISGTLHNTLPYRSIYFTVTGIALTDYKSFPTQICRICEENMISAYSFRQQCLETEEKLKELNSINEEVPPDMDAMSEEKSNRDPFEDINNEDNQQEEKEKKILCKRCKIVFKGLENFKMHKCKKEREIKPFQPKSVTKECPICGKMLKSSHFTSHMDFHNGIKRYSCQYCTEKFYWWTARRTHIYKEHLKRKVCKCPHCPREFYIAGQMNVHIQQKHSTKLNFQCELCGKAFKIKYNLKCHMKTHMDGGQCKVCGLTCSTLLALKNHTALHNKPVKYNCPICSKSLITFSLLQNHFKFRHPKQKHLLPPHPYTRPRIESN
ncbi:zinc finger protein 236-like [Phlebotomus papatasi]|uniref:zinc finger protein 236-like n=1 Tax=Phlebotomus papatasi TaxID=29031 RepID=UPI002484148F|nr:zinc finger protein 236-like [Phlebotomus papatasi]